MDLNEKIIKEELKYEGNFLKFVSIDVELPDGNKGNRDVIRHPGASAVLAFLDDETVLLVEQFRVALNKILLEIPAGKLEKGEDPKVCAYRELEEETGYKSEDIEYLGTIATGAGFTDEQIHIYKATNLYKGVKGGDDDEFIEAKPYKIKEIKEMIKDGRIIDTKTISAFMYL
ncbi:NUDIX hydrolase [Clostridium sardiniense]|uniref:NUDIX hydrolase n=1 Tax=Clostridium sardiniense TaxID=29369 RepID=A0ABS7L2Z2_CLOSR|nr:NUDIX hydrolase [Clostridium sardiniense]MBY0757410.1 NUDIX hydrolase [Clostridium sardiniense]MDQ0461961.1 ADP-ribose pyrophosphatase [Clostridium sardiniense]